MELGNTVRHKNSKYRKGTIVKVNAKSVWVDIGYAGIEERYQKNELVVMQWNEEINRWEDA